MEIFINELSLEGQFRTIDDFRDALLKFMLVFSKIETRIKEGKYYKDSLFVNREAISGGNFLSSFESLNDKGRDHEIKAGFRRIIFNRFSPVDWRREQLHTADNEYFCDKYGGNVCDSSVAEAAERKLQDKSKDRILVNLVGSRYIGTAKIDKNKSEIVDLRCIATIHDLDEFFPEEARRLDDFLKNPNRFSRTAFVQQGRVVYREIQTSRYWYLDNLHLSHFEVFDANGSHLGEASLEGVLDSTKRDNAKKISTK